MTAIQKRLRRLETAADRGEYEFAAVFLLQDKEGYHATVWQRFEPGFSCAMKSAFTITEAEAADWLIRELAGQRKALPVFYLDQKTEGIVKKIDTYAGGRFTPAKLDPLAWERAAQPWGGWELCQAN
jgi:hypothetical protein